MQRDPYAYRPPLSLLTEPDASCLGQSLEAILCQLQMASCVPSPGQAMGGLLQWTEGQTSLGLHHPPLASTATGCGGMGSVERQDLLTMTWAIQGAFGRIMANLTSLAQKAGPQVPQASITKRNQRRKLLWLVLLLAGVLSHSHIPSLVRDLGILPGTPLSAAPTIHPSTALDLLGLPSKNPKPDHASHLPHSLP